MEAKEYKKMYELENSHWWFVGKRLIVDRVIRKFIKGKEMEILDVGCGTGRMLESLRKYGNIIGLDFSEKALEFCKKRKIRNLFRASASELPFKNDVFDLVTAFDLLYHENIKDDVQVLKEFNRILEPYGYLVITECAFDFLKSKHDLAVQARERYTVSKLTKRLEKSGFSVVKISYSYFFFFPVVFMVKMFKKIKINTRGEPTSDLRSTSALINEILIAMLRIESACLSKINFPFGSSIVCLARKN